jgi:hypothetical protein
MQQSESNASQIVSSAPVIQQTGTSLSGIVGSVPFVPLQQYAPAWFYSALNWLGATYTDANNNEQEFADYLIGSNVDPYQQLGSTRLFVIVHNADGYLLTTALSVNGVAPLSGGTRYATTDAGILAMYNALAASPIFSSVSYCYVPGRLAVGTFADENLESGYDPSTGIRIILEGSAVAQVVPLTDFNATHNEQIYDPDPQIVPIVSALVFNVTQNNALGDTTFALPIYYARDLISGTYYVNKIETTTTLNGASVSCGQTALFPGGPGYDDSLAIALNLDGTSLAVFGGETVYTYTFDKATVISYIPLLPRVETGVCTLTYTGSSPAADFAKQNIAGFYRDPSWTTCLGLPIYDYGSANGNFTNTQIALTTPQSIYGTADLFLNGGQLQNVLQKLMQATYVTSSDELVGILDQAIAVASRTNGVGLSVTSAALDFVMSASGGATVVNELSVPVLATVTTTPQRIIIPDPVRFTEAAVTTHPVTGVSTITNLQPIGAGGSAPSLAQLSPTSVELQLTATVPQAALAPTNITSIELSTVFPLQTIGSGGAFEAQPEGTILNLMATSTPPLAPFALTLASTGVTFTSEVTYTFSLLGSAVSITGSDGSSTTAELASGVNADTTHTYVGMAAYTSATPIVQLYPLLKLAFAAPAVGTNGVQQGAPYSVRMTYAPSTCSYDIIDATQSAVASGVSVPTPAPTDNSTPQTGEYYFGSFIGGASSITVWSVPVFLAITPAELSSASASFFGTMTLGAQVSGLPAYDLTITDSSLFVYSNINIDTAAVGSVSANNVYIASAVINSAPDNFSPEAFAPSRLLMGLIRQVQMGGELVYAFIPEDDSVVIGGVRYMLSIINLGALTEDPNALPFPPSQWPVTRYWQFANRHDPYRAVQYTGETEDARLKQAATDCDLIGLINVLTQEPMQLVLDTNSSQDMVVWPIYPFPYATSTQSVDQGQLRNLTTTILNLLATTFPTQTIPTAAQLGEQILLPSALQQNNPYTYGVATSINPAGSSPIALDVATAPATTGQVVTNLAPNSIAQSNGSLAQTNGSLGLPAREVVQVRTEASNANAVSFMQASPQQIFGFSVYNPATGEAYIIEIVNNDLTPPNQLPYPTQDATYDPYYVRVVFLSTMTAYNMSIIVPSMARDQYGYLAKPETMYQNVLAQTNLLELGYMYQLADATGEYNSFSFVPRSSDVPPAGSNYLYTNLPYALRGGDRREVVASFLCRRRNWDVDCLLMQSTHPEDAPSAYVAYGAGDLVPLRLDGGTPSVDKRQPAHMVEFSFPISDMQYESAQTFSTGNTPYFVGVATIGNVQYNSVSISAQPATVGINIGSTLPLSFPPNIYVVGEASTTFSTVSPDTSTFVNMDDDGNVIGQQFQCVPYNNLVYLIRAVTNNPGLVPIGGAVSGLLIDTYVPTTSGNLALAQGARYKQSGLQYFGSTYTPTTMVDTLDQLDFTSITGETFYAPTIFIPIPQLDSTKGFIVTLSDFLGQQIWTIIYPEIVAQAGDTVNGVAYPNGYNVDQDGKPILSLQKLQFVYDPLAVMYTTNDLTHKYPLQPKQQVLALTNGQIREAISWRTANVQPDRLPPMNLCAQEILASGIGMDRTNIIYSSHNRAVQTPSSGDYMGMSVNSFISVSGVVYNIEESAMQNDQTGSSFISQVSTIENMLIGVLFDYDNNELGTLTTYDETLSNKGVVFINGYLGAAGFNFSSPDHFDANDVLPCQVPLLDEIADIFGWDVAFYNIDASLPQQYWSFTYDAFTAPGLPNYIPDVPPSPVDPTFSNRTRSLLLNMQNQVRPTQLGLIDTYSSVVSADLHLENGITGAIFLSKKADRDIASIGNNTSTPPPANVFPLYGLSLAGTYDFYIFSRDHYATLQDCYFELIDMGYAMCLTDNGTGTGTKNAQYYVDSDGNYYELYTYVLYSPSLGVLESSVFPLKVTLGSPANLSATPPVAETPNSVNPMDLASQINKVSNLVYAAFGPSSPSQPAAYIPIQAVGGEVQAQPIMGQPGFNGYNLNVVSTTGQPVQISQIYSGSTTYQIAGSTTIVPQKSGKAVPFYGSLSHGLDKQTTLKAPSLQSANLASFIPATTVPPILQATFGGNGQGSLIGTPFSCAFQGTMAIPPPITGVATPGTVIKGDYTVFYTFNGVTNGVMDSTSKSATASACQYFIDETDPTNPIYGVITLPKFTLNGNTYSINVNTTLSDGVTSRYTLVAGNKSYLFSSNNQVTADRTLFTFNALKEGIYTVTYAALDAPAVTEAPTPITLTPFTITAGGLTTVVDVFNNPGGLADMVLGVMGRLYTYNPVTAVVTVAAGATSTTAPIQTGIGFASNSQYAYVVAFENTGGTTGTFTVNGSPMYPYPAQTNGSPATYPIMTAPLMFTVGGNFYTFDQDATGDYLSVTGNDQTTPVNPYQFSLDGTIYIINSNVQPYTVVGGGNTYTMTTNNTQFEIDGVQYTITLKAGSLNGATISGQFNITQANVVVLENYAYELDIPNGQIVGNGTAYPLTTSGFTYNISTADQSYTVTTEANASTVTIGNVVYQINNTTVVGDSITYPILAYRTFADGTTTYQIGINGIANLPQPIALSSTTPPTFTDGATTYTVNETAAYNGTTYYLISGTSPSPAEFTAGTQTYQLRTDGVSIAAGPVKTYITTTGPLQPNQFTFGTETIYYGRTEDVAAFEGTNYYAIANNTFTDTTTGATYTLSGNTAVYQGNSYEIYSNLGQGAYFEVPGGKTYFVNVAVADTGVASGSIYQVFPISGGSFSMPVEYTITVLGSSVSVDAVTFTSGATVESTLTAAGGTLTGGYFTDPVTNITYTCVVDAGVTTFVDSNNTIYPYPAPGMTGVLVASVVVSTGVSLAVDSNTPPDVYPIVANEFIVGTAPNTTTYTVNLPVAYSNAAGPYYPMVNGQFIVPQTAPISNLSYTVVGSNVIKGWVISNDDEFSPDGNVVYTINEVNVVKATNQSTLSGSTLTSGSDTYTLNSPAGFVSTQPPGVSYNTTSSSFTVGYNGSQVTYTLAGSNVTDSRHPTDSFGATVSGSQVTFTDTVSGVTFTFNDSADDPITAEFTYANDFFVDAIAGMTYYIDTTDNHVEALSYLPETTQYAFTAANGVTYLIDYSDVNVVFPVISGANVNAGVATVGTDIFSIQISQVEPATGGSAIPSNQNSFEINGDLYTIAGTPSGANYSSCSVVGDAVKPVPFLSANTFKLTDPTVTYTLNLDANNLPETITASFAVRPSQDLISVNDNVYLITYTGETSGTLLGQGNSSIPISNSGFTLTNPFDSTKAKFIFDDLDIYDAGSVVGQFTAYLRPTFFIGNITYTLNTTTMLVTDNSDRPYPLIPNPSMFSINGFNYVIDTNRAPHAIVGNNNVSPLSTDVTVQNGVPVPNSTFTLNGQIYAYVEDAQHNLLAITGTALFPITQPAMTFKLSSLIFTISTTPLSGDYAGTDVPIGSVTAGSTGPITSATTILNLYAGTNESGGADYFMYKNQMYTLIKSAGVYTAVQETYTVYTSVPVSTQQQLAVFDLGGTTYVVTDGTTAGTTPAAGINPNTMWAQTAITPVETQFGLVYGFTASPTNVTQSATTNDFQFAVTSTVGTTTTSTLYNILYTAGSDANVVQVNVPDFLPTFTQAAEFDFFVGDPLTIETGGYNAFTATMAPMATPYESFAGAFRTPVVSTDSSIDSMIGAQGNFTLEFWHSIPLVPVSGYHPFTYTASTNNPLVYDVDVDFDDASTIYVRINNTVMQAISTPPAFSSRWRHFALSYTQPYTMICNGYGYQVINGSNYDVSSDFSVAMTFSAADINTQQGLLYKGTGSDNTTPELAMSYRVCVHNGAVSLQITTDDGNISNELFGPPIEPNTYYQVIVVKQTTTPASNTSTTSTDPYNLPFDSNEIKSAGSQGGSGTIGALPTSGTGAINITDVGAGNKGQSTPQLQTFLTNVANNATQSQSYTVTISVRTVNDDGGFGTWTSVTSAAQNVADADGLNVSATGSAHVLIGAAFDDSNNSMPFGTSVGVGNIRDLYIFNSAIDPEGIRSAGTLIDLADATTQDLSKVGILGYWPVAYDPNGVIYNQFNQNDVGTSTNASAAFLSALSGHELEGTSIYINGYPMTVTLATGGDVGTAMPPYAAGTSLLDFNAGAYKLEEISIWNMARAQYQVLDDMFGRLVADNEPYLAVYLSGEFSLQGINAPALPMNKYVDGVLPANAVTANDYTFTQASLDLIGSPCVGRCGPLITPNLYTPPGVALTVCDTVPYLTSYSVTLNTTTGTLAGEINEAYVYIKNNVLMIYAGKKVGDLTLTWVSQEQGNPQIIGYVEGAPPAPMANLTNKSSYDGATSITLTAPTSVTLKYQSSKESTTENKLSFGDNFGLTFGWGASVAPFGFGLKTKDDVWSMEFLGGDKFSYDWTDGNTTESTATTKLTESNKYTVKMQGTLAPYTNDQFMANLNTVTTPSTTPGTPGAKTPILPNPNLGGFTTSNSAAPLPKGSVTDEKFGQRMFVPSPYGQAFVVSQTYDIYQQTLVQSNTVYGFVAVPNQQIPRDLNVLSFRLNSQYIRPGCLDGMIGYTYNPTTLADGAQTYTTSTGQMEPLYDGNFAQGVVGHDASYMQLVQAYQVKKEIDQESFNTLAVFNSANSSAVNGNAVSMPDTALTPALDFYDEYVWSSRGATQEVKHTYETTYEEAVTTTNAHTFGNTLTFNMKISAMFITALDFTFTWDWSSKTTYKYVYTTTADSSFDVTASFDGVDTDTQMRYSSNNDAHFVMNFNSMFNPNNQSGIELVIGSDGLVYQIVPSVESGAGIPISNNLDTSMTYTQPQPSYATGNADGLTGNLEAYDRPGKTNYYRTYVYFLQPAQENEDDFWGTVIDPTWLANSPDPDAVALRTAQGNGSLPWRLFYRVTYSERFLPPITTGSTAIPQITPVMAVPVLNPATDFLFQSMTSTGTRPANNPANDIEANIVLASPTQSGLSAGTIPTSGTGEGLPVQPNNVIPFDLLKNASTIVDWDDSNNAKVLTQMITSVLGRNVVPMSPSTLPGSTLVTQVADPVNGGVLYSIYTDPNGLTVNVPTNFGISVYADVNGNPIQYFDGKAYHSLQADYVSSSDGTIMYYIQPPSTYDQSTFNLAGDYDLYSMPNDEWRYYLVSGFSSNMSSDASFADQGPFLNSAGYTGFSIAPAMHTSNGTNQVAGYVLAQGVLQYPNLNTSAETFSDVLVYKSMALLDTFPIGDPETLMAFLDAQYPNAPFIDNDEINLVFARNITSYMNEQQQALIPQ